VNIIHFLNYFSFTRARPAWIKWARWKHHLGNFTMFCQHSLCWTRSVEKVGYNLGQVKKKMFLVQISIKKKEAGGHFFFVYYFLLHAFFTPSPRDTLELLGQILIKQKIRYWLNTSSFNFHSHKGLTVKIYIILACTQQQWALHIFDVIRTPS